MFLLLINNLLEKWNVKVTITHRYLFDHVRSIINEMNQNRKAVHSMNTWLPTKHWNPGTPRNAKPIAKIMTRLARKRFRKLQLPTTQETFEAATALFINDTITRRVSVDLFSLHTTVTHGDFLEHVFCDYLNSPSAWQAYKMGGSPNRNPAPQLDYDLLAWEVYSRGWITNLTAYTRIMCRRDVANLLLKHDDSVLPLECASDEELELLYNISWDAEQSLFGQGASLEDHALTLKKAKANNTFCSVKPQPAVDMFSNEWEQYFREASK
jgi:hypothetical protein